jgi:hypothetical protein
MDDILSIYFDSLNASLSYSFSLFFAFLLFYFIFSFFFCILLSFSCFLPQSLSFVVRHKLKLALVVWSPFLSSLDAWDALLTLAQNHVVVVIGCAVHEISQVGHTKLHEAWDGPIQRLVFGPLKMFAMEQTLPTLLACACVVVKRNEPLPPQKKKKQGKARGRVSEEDGAAEE